MAEPRADGVADDPLVPRLESLFKTLDKCVRGVRMYRGEGAMVERMMSELEERARAAITGQAVTVRLAPFGLLYGGHPVTPPERRPPYLFRLFCDGVRELTFKPGIGGAELRRLVDVFASDDETGEHDDLVTLLWREDLPHVSFYAVDSLDASASDMVADRSLAGEEIDDALREAPDGGGGAHLALSADDIRLIRVEDLQDWVREAYAPALPVGPEVAATRAVREAYGALPRDAGRFARLLIGAAGDQAAPMLGDVLDALVRARDAAGLAAVLEVLADEAGAALRPGLLTPERLASLAPLVDAEPELLVRALEPLAADARDAMLALLTALPVGEGEAQVRELLARSGIELTPFYVKRLSSDDEETVRSAIAALGRIGSEEAVRALGEVLRSADPDRRRAALAALRDRYHESIRVELARALRDPDPENRRLAVRVLAASGDRRVAWALLSHAQRPDFAHADPEEQEELYRALAAFRDPRLLDHFASTLRTANLTGKEALTRRQLLCVEALREMGTPEAREVLESVRRRWTLPRRVKEAIAEALARWSIGK